MRLAAKLFTHKITQRNDEQFKPIKLVSRLELHDPRGKRTTKTAVLSKHKDSSQSLNRKEGKGINKDLILDYEIKSSDILQQKRQSNHSKIERLTPYARSKNESTFSRTLVTS